jgi:hypothetical protein
MSSCRTLDTNSRPARGSILQDTQAKNRNAVPVETGPADPRITVHARPAICPSRGSCRMDKNATLVRIGQGEHSGTTTFVTLLCN